MKHLLLILAFALTACGSDDDEQGAGVETCLTEVGGLSFYYKVVSYPSGDKLVACSLITSAAEYSHTDYYSSAQTGASDAGCTVLYDTDTASAGYWTFTNSGGVKKAVYSDSSSGSDGTTMEYEAADCTTAGG